MTQNDRLEFTVVNKSSEQKFGAKGMSKNCEQKMWTKAVSKSC